MSETTLNIIYIFRFTLLTSTIIINFDHTKMKNYLTTYYKIEIKLPILQGEYIIYQMKFL